MNIKELKEYHKNPRKISGERFDKLSDSLRSLGDLGGVVVNRSTKEIIGGNQRTKAFLKDADKYSIKILETFETPREDGTVAYGYVVRDEGIASEQKFSYREVEWDEATCERANVQANKLTGFWDYDILANSFDTDALLGFGFTEQELDLLPRPPQIETDQDVLSKSMDSYLGGNIKQLVLYFAAKDYEEVVGRLDRVMQELGLDNYTEAILSLLSEHENSRPKTEDPKP